MRLLCNWNLTYSCYWIIRWSAECKPTFRQICYCKLCAIHRAYCPTPASTIQLTASYCARDCQYIYREYLQWETIKRTSEVDSQNCRNQILKMLSQVHFADTQSCPHLHHKHNPSITAIIKP